MVIENFEHVPVFFEGSIIDLETIGDFDEIYRLWDPRRYIDFKPTIFGYICGNSLVQYCAEGYDEIADIISLMKKTLPNLERPFYAFNTNFEVGVIQNTCSYQPFFIDIRDNLYGSKWDIRKQLDIFTYNDPFNGEGCRCDSEWKIGNYDDCMKHNRACLLIERDIHDCVRSLKTGLR
jgi:hypothetical protein